MISQFLLPDSFYKPSGGMGVHCRELVLAFLKDNRDVIFDIISDADPPVTSRGANCFVTGVSNVPPISSNPSPEEPIYIKQMDFIQSALTRPPPDIVHSCDWLTAYSGIKISSAWKVPYIHATHLSVKAMYQSIIKKIGSCSIPNELLKMSRGHTYTSYREADAIICPSLYYYNKIPIVFRDKGVIVPNGIDLSKWLCPYPAFDFPGKNKMKVIYLGRIDYMKNTHQLIKIKPPKNVDIIIIGGPAGGNSKIYNDVVKICGDSETSFYHLGPLYGEEKIRALQSANAVIMPSIHEPFGIVALEALASQSILLSSYTGGMKEFLDITNSIYCGYKIEDMEAALLKFTELSVESKDALISNGLDVCSRFTWERAAIKLNAVYESALKEYADSIKPITFETAKK